MKLPAPVRRAVRRHRVNRATGAAQKIDRRYQQVAQTRAPLGNMTSLKDDIGQRFDYLYKSWLNKIDMI